MIKRHSTDTVQVLFYQRDQDFDLLDYQADERFLLSPGH